MLFVPCEHNAHPLVCNLCLLREIEGLYAQLAKAKAEAAPLRAALEAQGVEVPGSGWHAFGCAQYAGTGNMKCLRRCSLGRAALDALKGEES